LRLDTAEEIALFSLTRKRLLLEGGILVANPVPLEDEIPAKIMAKHIMRATDEAEAAAISGKAVTPWLLSRILELSKGESLVTNIALVKNNAKLATAIACELIKPS
jgi:pseudouridine-5'-phosphate glycosidase